MHWVRPPGAGRCRLAPVDVSPELLLLFAVAAAIAGVAGAFVVKGLWTKLFVLAVGLVVAAYLAGFIPDYFAILP
jgi:hypothetical protein